MSNAVLVFCRERPDLPEEGELEEAPVYFRVRAATPADDQISVGHHEGTFGPDARVEAGEMKWVVEMEFPVSVEFDAFHAGATVLASRSGGGLVYSVPGGKVIEVARPSAPGSSKRTVLQAVDHAFRTMSEHEDDDEEEEDEDE